MQIDAVRPRTLRTARKMRGVTLIELMVALVLGLIVTGAALTLFVTNRATYTASENLGRMQEAKRTAFDLMARDIREAAASPCDSSTTPTNALNATTDWWNGWGIRGYAGATAFPDDAFGTGAGQRVDGTPAFEFKSASPTGAIVTTDMALVTSPIVVNSLNGIAAGDLLVICDFNHGSLFQVTSTGGTSTINHAASGTPGNATGNLPPDVYKAAFGNDVGASVGKFRASRWFIGYNDRGTKSLYQSSLRNVGGALTVVKDEIAEGVDDMTLQYLESGATSYVDAPTDWSTVQAIKLGLTFHGRDRIGTDGNVLERTEEHVITLRERAP